jgi:hypothetical protein
MPFVVGTVIDCIANKGLACCPLTSYLVAWSPNPPIIPDPDTTPTPYTMDSNIPIPLARRPTTAAPTPPLTSFLLPLLVPFEVADGGTVLSNPLIPEAHLQATPF